jgi:hypothetical protein
MLDARILVMDSVTKVEAEDFGKVLIAASHGGVYAGYLAAAGHARGVILNDAGGGLDGAGYGALDWADGFGMPVAVVDCMSARIGDGQDMAANGVISRANNAAVNAGCQPGMAASEAAALMLATEMWSGDAPSLPESRFEISEIPGKRRVFGCDSASLIKEGEDAGQIIVCGSHGGLFAGNSAYILKAPLYGVILNDAGLGKEDAGVQRVHAAVKMGIAAAAVASTSARIGDARSIWDTGIISVLNAFAEEKGGRVGMTSKEYVAALQASDD